MGPKDRIKIPILSSDVRVVLRPGRIGIHTNRIDPLKWRSALLTSGSGIHTVGIDPLYWRGAPLFTSGSEIHTAGIDPL